MIRTLKTRECVENVKESKEKDLYEEGKWKEKYGERHKSNLNIIQSVKLISDKYTNISQGVSMISFDTSYNKTTSIIAMHTSQALKKACLFSQGYYTKIA